MKLTGLIAVAALVLSGCASAPDSIDAGWTHVSHPLLGRPFGPSDEEDTLDVLGVRARWTRGPYFVEAGLGQQMRDAGFYGDGFIFTSRVGVALWER